MTPAILILVVIIFLNGLMVHFEIGSPIRELTRVLVLVALGHLIYKIIKRPNPKS